MKNSPLTSRAVLVSRSRKHFATFAASSIVMTGAIAAYVAHDDPSGSTTDSGSTSTDSGSTTSSDISNDTSGDDSSTSGITSSDDSISSSSSDGSSNAS